MKAAVIGCGRMGAFTSESVRRFAPACWLPLAHADAIQTHPALNLAALCDPDSKRLEDAQAAYGAPGYSDYQTMLETVRPTLVGIATRTPGRAQIIADCVAAGVRALHIEKPLCNSVGELEALASLFRRNDIHVTYGAIRRLFEVYGHARTLAWSGRFGRLVEIRVAMGAGRLYWTHPHSVDLILWAAGDRQVVGVQAKLDETERGAEAGHILSDPIIESASIWFDDGLAGHIGRAPGADLILSCERGEVAVLNDGRSIVISSASGDDPYPDRAVEPWQSGAGPEGSYAAIAQLVGCLQGDADALAANEIVKRDILVGQRALFAFAESHLTGSRIVTPDQVPHGFRIDAGSGARAA